ncbi:putative DNA binding domain-containing protein [Prevotella sp. 20925_1_30]|uniref:RNA-binding domain-containing protein n=1 Tax=Prevotella sp. 20925_1_30 TaxID=3003679 RepID=UPI00352F2ADA
MTRQEISEYIRIQYPRENERCEWKEYKNLKNSLCGHEGDDVVSYVSAISNMNGGAIVIGVQDKTFEVIGIQNFGNYSVESAKAKISEKCRNLPIENLEIDELKANDTGDIVWIVNIPKHKARLPVYAHNKAWQRVGDSLIEIKRERIDSILSELVITEDWSVGIIPQATIDDLDSDAIEKARKEYIIRNPYRKAEISAWSNDKFLDKAKVTINGKITRAALILLGKEESEHFLSPYVACIRWSLRSVGTMQNKDYEILPIPLLLSVDRLYNKVRNVKYRLVRPDSLFPDEMLRYDMFNIREPLNNAIAHQDYTKCARIEVVEYEDSHIIFQNYGEFLPQSVENVVTKDCPESVYRNRFLVEAMRNFNMIETEGGGIKKMFINQRVRLFPMPEYDFSNGKVRVIITGKVIDENFARILTDNPRISLEDIILLDKVQKQKLISDEQVSYLRKKKLIEGRKPHFYLVHKIVSKTKDIVLKSQYIKNRSFDDEYFMNMIIEYLKRFGKASRKDINDLLKNKLSDVLNNSQKTNKIDYLLKKLKKSNVIKVDEKRFWILVS